VLWELVGWDGLVTDLAKQVGRDVGVVPRTEVLVIDGAPLIWLVGAELHEVSWMRRTGNQSALVQLHRTGP